MANAPGELHVFHTGDSNEYWIAMDPEDVRALQQEVHGCPDEVDDIRQLADDRVLTFWLDEDEPDSKETHTCAEWVEQGGRGLLAACEP